MKKQKTNKILYYIAGLALAIFVAFVVLYTQMGSVFQGFTLIEREFETEPIGILPAIDTSKTTDPTTSTTQSTDTKTISTPTIPSTSITYESGTQIGALEIDYASKIAELEKRVASLELKNTQLNSLLVSQDQITQDSLDAANENLLKTQKMIKNLHAFNCNVIYALEAGIGNDIITGNTTTCNNMIRNWFPESINW